MSRSVDLIMTIDLQRNGQTSFGPTPTSPDGPNIAGVFLLRNLPESEERFCPVWAMLKAGTTTTSSFLVIERTPGY